MKVKGKNILITGASSGIVKAFALKCANDICHIYLASRNREKLEEVKKVSRRFGLPRCNTYRCNKCRGR